MKKRKKIYRGSSCSSCGLQIAANWSLHFTGANVTVSRRANSEGVGAVRGTWSPDSTMKRFIVIVLISLLLIGVRSASQATIGMDQHQLQSNSSRARLAKLVKFFSKPGAFKSLKSLDRDEQQIFKDDSAEAQTFKRCSEDLECKRAEARRSVDCPRGDCYCQNCSRAGPELWSSCCRESFRCCSHLAAACRNCDQPALYPFCGKHFKKCTTLQTSSPTVTT